MSRPNLHFGPKVGGRVGKDVDTNNKVVLTGCDSQANVLVGPEIASDVGGTLKTVQDAQITYSDKTGEAGSSLLQVKKTEAEQVVPQIKGHVVIFNQEFKKDTENFRLGSANDVKRLKTTFARFGIDPVDKPDLIHEDIVKEIDLLSTKTDFSTVKLFVCIFMSHGQANDIVLAADDKKFILKETIIDPIMQNRTLKGVAKIFIIVACRGDNRHDLDMAGHYREFDRVELDASVVRPASAIDYSNCIFSYSTIEDHVSLRTPDGTFFIQDLCDNIDKANGDTLLHSIFAEVNSKLSSERRQVPVFKTTMGNVSFKDLV